MDMQISNENIIYIYLKTKKEVIDLDQRRKELKLYVEESNKMIEDKLGNEGQGLGEMMKFISMLGNLTGSKIDFEEIKKRNQEELDKFEAKVEDLIDDNIKSRVNVLKDLQVAYDVLKHEMPDLIEKYTDLIMNKNIAGVSHI